MKQIFNIIMFDNNIIYNILRNTASGKDFKNFSLVSKTWHGIIESIFPGGDKFANHLLTLISMFPDADWDYYNIRINPSIGNSKNAWSILDNNSLSRHVTWQTILDNPDKEWHISWMSVNPNITIDIIKANPERNWDYGLFSYCNASITWQTVLDNPDFPWDYAVLFYNIELTSVMINSDDFWYEYGRKILPNFNVRSTADLSSSVNNWLTRFNLSVDYIENNPDILNSVNGWDLFDLKSTVKLSEKFILTNLDRFWSLKLLSKNPNISLENLKMILPKYGTSSKYISFNPNITWRIVAKNPDMYVFKYLSENTYNSLRCDESNDKK